MSILELYYSSNSVCYFCGKPSKTRFLIVNRYNTISNEFVCLKCAAEREYELGFQCHSVD